LKNLHPWDVTPAQARAIQEQLREQLVRRDDFARIETIAGIDIGFEEQGQITRAAVVLLRFPDLETLDQAVARRPTGFPYVPGLLSFREIPAALDALVKLRVEPDLLLCDGQGYAHPRRFGLACHLGLLTGLPSIGVAKSRLIGEHGAPCPGQGRAHGVTARGRGNRRPAAHTDRGEAGLCVRGASDRPGDGAGLCSGLRHSLSPARAHAPGASAGIGQERASRAGCDVSGFLRGNPSVLLIPAIDLKDGRCVRLRQGRMDEETVFSDDPVRMAGRWVRAGARRLHLVDLNGAFAGKPVNDGAVRAIAARYPELPIQVGGGIRDEATIAAYLKAGVSSCIIGTQAVKEPALVTRACKAFPGHIIVGLDAREGQVAIEGWAEVTEHPVADLAKRFEADGVSAIVYTDIGRDGMMTGPNVEATRALAETISIPVIASGGITNLDDVRALCAVADSGITAAITGRAIYEGTLDFAAGQRVADEC